MITHPPLVDEQAMCRRHHHLHESVAPRIAAGAVPSCTVSRLLQERAIDGTFCRLKNRRAGEFDDLPPVQHHDFVRIRDCERTVVA